VGSVALHDRLFTGRDHAEVLVVEQRNLTGKFLAEAGGPKFLDVHFGKLPFAIDIDNERVRYEAAWAPHGGGQSNPILRVAWLLIPGSRVAEFGRTGQPTTGAGPTPTVT